MILAAILIIATGAVGYLMSPATPVAPVVTPPPVLTGKVFLLAVYDAMEVPTYPAAQQAILLPPDKGGSDTIAPGMKALGIEWQSRDINDSALGSGGAISWKTAAINQGLPCVIAIGQDGQKVSFWTGPLSVDEAAAVGMGRKLVGK